MEAPHENFVYTYEEKGPSATRLSLNLQNYNFKRRERL